MSKETHWNIVHGIVVILFYLTHIVCRSKVTGRQ
jgi:hypothetical protein